MVTVMLHLTILLNRPDFNLCAQTTESFELVFFQLISASIKLMVGLYRRGAVCCNCTRCEFKGKRKPVQCLCKYLTIYGNFRVIQFFPLLSVYRLFIHYPQFLTELATVQGSLLNGRVTTLFVGKQLNSKIFLTLNTNSYDQERTAVTPAPPRLTRMDLHLIFPNT